ncbi:MAG: prepilin-type N-terminal cleavage/methylation domain-containing protein [Phycisphaerales bacterium]
MRGRRAFSLIELVIVVVILGIIGAIAIPRMSRSRGTANSAVMADLAALRNAIEMFRAEHSGLYPDETTVGDQLTQYSDISGDAQATTDAAIYGPYLHSIPKQKVEGAKPLTPSPDRRRRRRLDLPSTDHRIYANVAAGVKDQNGVDYRD